MTAGFAVHMINTQNDVLNRLDQIKVKTLIATGTDDILTAESGVYWAEIKILFQILIYSFHISWSQNQKMKKWKK